MQLVLELLKKIFVALQGVYTKAETDEIAAPIDWLKSAVDGDWKTYMLARAGMTGVQANIDTVSRAIKEYNADNTSELAGRLIEDWTNLYFYELFAEMRFSSAFWVSFFDALATWEADPTATKEWQTTRNEDGTITSTSEYYYSVADKPIIDFAVTICRGANNHAGALNAATNVPIYLPNATNNSYMFQGTSVFNQPMVFPKTATALEALYGASAFNKAVNLPISTNCSYLFYGARKFNSKLNLPRASSCAQMLSGASSFNLPLSLPNATTCTQMLQAASSFNQSLDLPKATACQNLVAMCRSFNQPLNLPSATNCICLCYQSRAFNQTAILPSCSNGLNAFSQTAMDANNISATLDGLPSWHDGGNHVIGFVDCPGAVITETTETFSATDADGTTYSLDNCPTFDTDDADQTLRKAFVLATVKKGWDVQVGTSE